MIQINRRLDALNTIIPFYSSGSISLGDLYVLLRYCDEKDIVVELGTNTGSTARLLSMRCNKVYTVDVFEKTDLIKDEMHRNLYTRIRRDLPVTYESACLQLSDCKNVQVMQCMTTEAAKIFDDGDIDTLFIDADHSYEGVKADYEAFFQKVKIGGVFLFHDTISNLHDGSVQFKKEVLDNDKRLVALPVSSEFEGILLFTSISAYERKEQ